MTKTITDAELLNFTREQRKAMSNELRLRRIKLLCSNAKKIGETLKNTKLN